MLLINMYLHNRRHMLLNGCSEDQDTNTGRGKKQPEKRSNAHASSPPVRLKSSLHTLSYEQSNDTNENRYPERYSTRPRRRRCCSAAMTRGSRRCNDGRLYCEDKSPLIRIAIKCRDSNPPYDIHTVPTRLD